MTLRLPYIPLLCSLITMYTYSAVLNLIEYENVMEQMAHSSPQIIATAPATWQIKSIALSELENFPTRTTPFIATLSTKENDGKIIHIYGKNLSVPLIISVPQSITDITWWQDLLDVSLLLEIIGTEESQSKTYYINPASKTIRAIEVTKELEDIVPHLQKKFEIFRKKRTAIINKIKSSESFNEKQFSTLLYSPENPVFSYRSSKTLTLYVYKDEALTVQQFEWQEGNLISIARFTGRSTSRTTCFIANPRKNTLQEWSNLTTSTVSDALSLYTIDLHDSNIIPSSEVAAHSISALAIYENDVINIQNPEASSAHCCSIALGNKVYTITAPSTYVQHTVEQWAVIDVFDVPQPATFLAWSPRARESTPQIFCIFADGSMGYYIPPELFGIKEGSKTVFTPLKDPQRHLMQKYTPAITP